MDGGGISAYKARMAVYTEIDDAELQLFMAAYGLGEVLSCKGIAEGIENSNFALTTDVGPFILTIYEKRVSAADLPFFLGLMQHLAASGIPCPVPVETRHGEVLRTLSGKPAALVTYLAGIWPKRPSAEQCTEVGDTLARLHLAADGFQMRRDNALGRGSWRPLLASVGVGADVVKSGLRHRLSDELDFLDAHWPQGLPGGIIHADLFPDNVFFRSGHLSGVIDFYFACHDFLAYDLAVCLNAWCFEADGSFNATKARRLVAGYRGCRPLSDAELAALPVLARGAALRFLLTRLYDWLNTPESVLVRRKDPLEYLRKLEFHAAAGGAQSYGID